MSHLASGLRALAGLRADIGIERLSAALHLLGFPC